MTPLKYMLRAVYWLILIATPPALSHVLQTRCSCPPLPPTTKIILTGVGALLAVLGIYLNAVAGRLLRTHGHTRKTRRFTAPDKLVDTGVYSCMRHPAQLGLILIGVATGLASSTLIGLIAASIPIAGGLLFILYIEEPEARRLLGRAYHEYEERVPPFSLRPSCLLGKPLWSRGERVERGGG